MSADMILAAWAQCLLVADRLLAVAQKRLSCFPETWYALSIPLLGVHDLCTQNNGCIPAGFSLYISDNGLFSLLKHGQRSDLAGVERVFWRAAEQKHVADCVKTLGLVMPYIGLPEYLQFTGQLKWLPCVSLSSPALPAVKWPEGPFRLLCPLFCNHPTNLMFCSVVVFWQGSCPSLRWCLFSSLDLVFLHQ